VPDPTRPATATGPALTLTVDLARIGAEWAATSAQVTGLRLYADDRAGVEEAVRKELALWLDPAVKVVFRESGA
jgi:hypothetical protein